MYWQHVLKMQTEPDAEVILYEASLSSLCCCRGVMSADLQIILVSAYLASFESEA